MSADESTLRAGCDAHAESLSELEAAAARRARRARLDAIFGDVLPDQTRDDVDRPASSSGTSDQWYRDQVPPHHGHL